MGGSAWSGKTDDGRECVEWENRRRRGGGEVEERQRRRTGQADGVQAAARNLRDTVELRHRARLQHVLPRAARLARPPHKHGALV